MFQYLHKNCNGIICKSPEHDESYCERCGKWINSASEIKSAIMEVNSSNLGHGGPKMGESKDLINLIDRIVSCNGKYYPGEGWFVDYSDIDNDDIEEAVAQLMAEDDDIAHEATNADNPAFDKRMLPALIRHLQNPCNKDEQIEFMKEWRSGVIEYCRGRIESLIEDRAAYYDFEEEIRERKAEMHMDWEAA